jgi:hypothetical protein
MQGIGAGSSVGCGSSVGVGVWTGSCVSGIGTSIGAGLLHPERSNTQMQIMEMNDNRVFFMFTFSFYFDIQMMK